MKVFHALDKVESEESAVAIGNFDGVHLGHQALISRLVERAKAQKLVPTILTFYPHPVEVLNPAKKLERLTTASEKLVRLESVGIEKVLVAPFNSEVAALSPDAFFDKYLKQGLQAKRVHVGFNFYFGKDRKGDTKLLESLCQKNGIEFHAEAPFELGGTKVSSSTIRDLVREGEIKKAAELLGCPYWLGGTVAAGGQRGRQLGFPTANLHCPREKLLPKNGVYVTRVEWQKQTFKSVSNVGVRPTFHAEASGKVVEVHLLDFNQRLYDEVLKVEFLERLRDEKKFSGIDELKAQIAADVATARRMFV